MLRLGEIRVDAMLDNLRTISHFIQGVGERLQMTNKSLFDIELAVEEAVVNIINHAYPVNSTGDILLRAESKDDLLYLTLIDWGMEFDPAGLTPFDITAPIETRIQGGMGLYFIESLMDELSRETSPLGQPNVLTMKKQFERLPVGLHFPNAARELNAMLSISQRVATSTDLDQLLHQIVTVLVDIIDAERGTLYLVDEEKDQLYSQVLMEETGKLQEIRVKIGEGIAGEVASTGRIANIRKAYDDPHFQQSFDQITGFRSDTILAAPMFNNQREIIGVVQLLNKKGGNFTFRDERLLSAMASQAAISIENARLYKQEIRQQLIEQELQTARDIQTSFLPNTVPAHESWDIAYFWRPMREVGGDFYDFHTLPDGRLAIAIADVSGKGVPAAMFMALCVTILRFAMSLDFRPADLLARANQLLLAEQSSRMFATVFMSYIDYESGSVEFASAGHNPPLLFRAATGKCEYLEVTGVAIGIFRLAKFEQGHTILAPGDVLVLYTDGITEAIDQQEQEFGEARLEQVICDYANEDCEVIISRVMQAVNAYSDNIGFDDETLIVIKHT